MAHLTQIVTTKSGPVQGFIDTFPLRDKSAFELVAAGENGAQEGVQKWLNMPYAQAGRWKRPEDPSPWEEVRVGKDFGTMFPQPPSNAFKLFAGNPGVFAREHVGVSEASHSINVFAPKEVKEGDNVAVMVWIYGGSLNNGSADRFLYDPTELIRREEKSGKKVIVVTFNYRTNVFGFMASQDLWEEDEDGICGNYGLRDCVKALEWVQANIKSFGGDPKNVTVFGESAGGFIISHLLVSGRYLFKNAIMQSGSCGTMRMLPPSVAYPAYSAVLNAVGPSAATASGRIAALRQVPALELLKVHTENFKFGGVSLTLESGSKAIWKEETLDVLERGGIDSWIETVVCGTNKDEGTMFVLSGPDTLATFQHYVSTFPVSLQTQITAKYLPQGVEGHPARDDFVASPAAKLFGDWLFQVPKWEMLQAISSQKKAPRVYDYLCRMEVMGLANANLKLGAMHAVEIPLIFNTASLWDFDESSKEAKAAKDFGGHWVELAINGVPGSNWKPFTSEEPNELVLTEGGTVELQVATGYYDSLIDFNGRRANALGKTSE